MSFDITEAFITEANIVGGRNLVSGEVSSEVSSEVNEEVNDLINRGGDLPENIDHDRDEVLNKLVPEEIGECLAAPEGHCMSTHALEKVGRAVGVSSDDSKVSEDSKVSNNDVNIGGSKPTKKNKIIEAAKKKTKCGTELCILNALVNELGSQLVHAEITTNFKIEGPLDDSLLTNYNIDDIMRQFTKKFPGFYAYNFNMRNYKQYRFERGRVINEPDSLHTMPFGSLYGKYNCAGCVINTDVYQGSGEHWMALFVDARTPKCTVEFFNSSGEKKTAWVPWMIKTRDDMTAHMPTEIIFCDTIKHQSSMSECGLYSLFYIYARLNGIPAEYFKTKKIKDKHMFAFRQHLYKDNNAKYGVIDGKFSWDEYQKKVKIKWEPYADK